MASTSDTFFPTYFEVQFGWSIQTEIPYDYLPKESLHIKHHHGYLLHFVHKDGFDIRVNKQILHCPKGSIIGLPPNTYYDILLPPASSSRSAIGFPPTTLHEISGLPDFKFTRISFRLLLFGVIDLTHLLCPINVFNPTTKIQNSLDLLFEEIYLESNNRENRSEFVVEAMTRTVVGYCWEPLGMDEVLNVSQGKIPDWLGSLLQLIRHSPDLTIKRLVKKSGYSRTQFGKLFKRYIGQTPKDYLQLRRIEFARKMLTKTDIPVQRIAEELGFTNTSDFSRFFTKRMGVSPTEFRQTEPHGSEQVT